MGFAGRATPAVKPCPRAHACYLPTSSPTPAAHACAFWRRGRRERATVDVDVDLASLGVCCAVRSNAWKTVFCGRAATTTDVAFSDRAFLAFRCLRAFTPPLLCCIPPIFSRFHPDARRHRLHRPVSLRWRIYLQFMLALADVLQRILHSYHIIIA